jgi:hypothetical protein
MAEGDEHLLKLISCQEITFVPAAASGITVFAPSPQYEWFEREKKITRSF